MDETLKKAVADAIRKSGLSTVIGRKLYTAEELAREVENETEIGKKMIEIAIKGTIERYQKGK
ncbi:hypothetical protein DRO59_00555 [Candidatus Bathyarchaeota archaeon]|nr:MAG: hypothetical protein DRO59_00555 [Candidatus Bathyarchaeota archaeon]